MAVAQVPLLHAQHGAKADGEWPTYGGDLGNTKYSPLDQIDADNFGNLKVVWRWQSADGFLSKTYPGGGELWTNSRFIFEELNREDPNRWRDGDHFRLPARRRIPANAAYRDIHR